MKKVNHNLLGISGYIGSGKDTFANMIQAHIILSKDPDFFNVPIDNSIDPETDRFPMHDVLSILKLPTLPFTLDRASGWETKRFADKLKTTVSLFTGIPKGDLERQEVKDSFLGPEWNYWIYSNDYVRNRVFFSEEEARNVPPKPVGGGFFLDSSNAGLGELIEKRMTVRYLLQNLGTNAMRNVIHPNIHVNGLFADYIPIIYWMCDRCDSDNLSHLVEIPSRFPEYVGNEWVCPICKGKESEGDITQVISDTTSNWIIRDTRFHNEAEAIKNRGGIIVRIERVDGLSTMDRHISETSMDDWKFDYVIQNDSTFEDLFETAGRFCVDLGLI